MNFIQFWITPDSGNIYHFKQYWVCWEEVHYDLIIDNSPWMICFHYQPWYNLYNSHRVWIEKLSLLYCMCCIFYIKVKKKKKKSPPQRILWLFWALPQMDLGLPLYHTCHPLSKIPNMMNMEVTWYHIAVLLMKLTKFQM